MKRSLVRGVKSLKRCRLRQGYSESLREQAAWQATDYADVTDLWDSRLASDTDALQLPIRGHSRVPRAEEKRRSSAALQDIRVIRVIRGYAFFGFVSLLQADLFQERYEARLRANGIPAGVDFQFWQPGSSLLNRPFEPIAGKVRSVSV